MIEIGKILLIAGIFLIILGILFIFNAQIPFIGKLPGDIHIKKDNFTVYFPFMTSILLSIFLSLLFWLFRKH